MAIQRISGYEAPVEALFGLANTSFEAAPFRAACERFATFNKSSSDSDLWWFSVGGPGMLVGVGDTGRVSCAILSICWWETYSPTQHPDQTSWKTERSNFDRFYVRERKRAVAVLGPPALDGQDTDADAHRWAIWRGQTGLLVLQQSSYDPQFGLDVNYWVQPWLGDDPRPGSPFIDWLFSLQRPQPPKPASGHR